MVRTWLWLLVILQILESGTSKRSSAVSPPLPILPIPNASQLKWQQRELVMFMHFGVNTFTDSEWGTGQESPSIFNPTSLDANQWVDVAAQAGFSLMILTAKHHDGFCLWPSKYTDHSVEGSPWKNGHGDVVQELVNAAKARSIDVGLYLSPWDRHEKTYGLELQYNEHYMAQLQELLSRYGAVSEIWFDGAKGSNAPNMTYYFADWFAMVKELQGSINIFSDAGPDVRWVGDEQGAAGTTCWSPINRTSLRIGDGSIVGYLNKGDSRGTDWLPPECDVSIRTGWFWHKSERPKRLSQLLHIYYNSVGRNCVMLLNVPPNTSGLISQPDIKTLREFRRAIDTIFSNNLASNSTVKASSQRGGRDGDFTAKNVLTPDIWSYWAPKEAEEKPKGHWIEFKLRKEDGGKGYFSFNVVRIQEAIGLGQRVKKHIVCGEVLGRGNEVLVNGTTIGYKRLHRLKTVVHARSVRIQIIESRAPPLIASAGLHFDPYWNGSNGTRG